SVPPSSCTSGLSKRFRCARRGARESAGVSIQMDRNRVPSLISAIRLSLLPSEIGKEKGEPRATDLFGGMFSNWLERTLLCPSNRDRGHSAIPTFSQ